MDAGVTEGAIEEVADRFEETPQRTCDIEGCDAPADACYGTDSLKVWLCRRHDEWLDEQA